MSNDVDDENFVIVGIGASAGGLMAIRQLLPGLPQKPNMAYLIVHHAAADQPTHLPALLATSTDMPVMLLDCDTVLDAAHIYVLAPGRGVAEIDGRRVVVTDNAVPSTVPHTVDILFATLAEALGDRSIGIVLSGTGSDGERGMRAIKKASGVTFVQDPTSAEFPGMPTAVIDAGLADFVLSPAAIATELADGPALSTAKSTDGKQNDKANLVDLHDLLDLLRKKTGFDFQHYRESTIRRRIERRLAVHRLDRLEDYQDLIESSDQEVNFLLQDVFINVTKFFRDPATFIAIGQALRGLAKRKTANDSLRIWVPGCATGEEAFSIAIQLAEELGDRLNDFKIQIFATDIDDGAIAEARKSVYLEPQVDGLSKTILERYFDDLDGAYRVKSELRDLVVFARHDLMQDPPFNHLDLISCRNVLIYFKRPMQERTISVFHYALKPGGFLVLGPSESVGKVGDQFEMVDKGVKLFMRIGQNRLTPSILETAQHRARRREPAHLDMPKPISMEDRANKLLIEGYGPPGVLVSQMLKVEFVRGDVSRFLHLRPGDADLSVVDMAIDPLRLEVRLVLQKAQRERVQIRGQAIAIKDSLGRTEVTPIVVPTMLGSDDGSISLLLFETREVVEGQADGATTEEVSDLRVRELEHELAATREHLQTSIEELEASNEELQSTVEEFQSTTEELQSGNEELQTTNEELQSTNEELQTVNDELKTKTEELSLANDDLQNILNVALSGIIVLDDQLRITRYSAASKEIYKLWPTSIGKPLIGMESLLDLSILSQQIEEAVKSGEASERQLDLGDKAYSVKLIPLFDNDRPAGLIVTFDDVTLRRRIEADSRRLAAVVRDSNDAITVHDFEGNIQAWNRVATEAYGFSEVEAESHNIFEFVPDDASDDYRVMIKRLETGEEFAPLIATRMARGGEHLRVQLTLTLLRDDLNRPMGIATTERLMPEGE
ncbi:MAG: CheR family methyltransferase [Geminicoccales bacterium]